MSEDRFIKYKADDSWYNVLSFAKAQSASSQNTLTNCLSNSKSTQMLPPWINFFVLLISIQASAIKMSLVYISFSWEYLAMKHDPSLKYTSKHSWASSPKWSTMYQTSLEHFQWFTSFFSLKWIRLKINLHFVQMISFISFFKKIF